MWNKYFYLALISLVIVSCDNHNSPSATAPESYVTLVKFTDPSYVNNLIVNDYKNSEHFILMRGNRCSENYYMNSSGKDWPYDFSGLEDRTPYIELTDGWYLIDWTWEGYPYNGQTLLTEVTWDNYNGEYTFDKSTSHISSNKICIKKYVSVQDLVIYSYPDGNYPTYPFKGYNSKGTYVDEDVNEYLYHAFLLGNAHGFPSKPFLSENGDCLCNMVEDLDTLWDVFRQQLITLIKNGDLESIKHATPEQILELIGKYN